MVERTLLQKQTWHNDWVVGVTFILMIAVKLCTVFIIGMTVHDTGASIQAVATAYEQNALFSLSMNLSKIALLASVIVVPAALMAYYYVMRKRVLNGKMEIDSLTYIVMISFFAMLINISNDGALLLGKLAGV